RRLHDRPDLDRAPARSKRAPGSIRSREHRGGFDVTLAVNTLRNDPVAPSGLGLVEAGVGAGEEGGRVGAIGADRDAEARADLQVGSAEREVGALDGGA